MGTTAEYSNHVLEPLSMHTLTNHLCLLKPK